MYSLLNTAILLELVQRPIVHHYIKPVYQPVQNNTLSLSITEKQTSYLSSVRHLIVY